MSGSGLKPGFSYVSRGYSCSELETTARLSGREHPSTAGLLKKEGNTRHWRQLGWVLVAPSIFGRLESQHSGFLLWLGSVCSPSKLKHGSHLPSTQLSPTPAVPVFSPQAQSVSPDPFTFIFKEHNYLCTDDNLFSAEYKALSERPSLLVLQLTDDTAITVLPLLQRTINRGYH